MEGYWINAKTGKYFEIYEHAGWIHDSENQKLIGLPEEIGKKISAYPGSDFKYDIREEIVVLATQGGLIRVRRYGGAVSFEFWSQGINRTVLDTIFFFLLKTDIPGDYTQLSIHNLATNESIDLLWKDFKSLMEEDNIESILRVGKRTGRRKWLPLKKE